MRVRESGMSLLDNAVKTCPLLFWCRQEKLPWRRVSDEGLSTVKCQMSKGPPNPRPHEQGSPYSGPNRTLARLHIRKGPVAVGPTLTRGGSAVAARLGRQEFPAPWSERPLLPRIECSYREPAHFSKFSWQSQQPDLESFLDNHLTPPTSPNFKRSSHNR